MPEIYDHAGDPVIHGWARVDGIRMHYVTAGQGEPLLLLHGTPKTHFYWYKLIPLLTEHFTVVAPDLRGFGDTDRPTPEEGYDSRTNADDMAELMTSLGHDTFHHHGEDRGAEFAYVLARRSRTGSGRSASPRCCSRARGSRSGRSSRRRTSHRSSTSRACGSGTSRSSGSPTSRRCSSPGTSGSSGSSGSRRRPTTRLRSAGGDRRVDQQGQGARRPARGARDLSRRPQERPHQPGAQADQDHHAGADIGAPEFFGELVEGQMLKVAEKVERAEVFEACGHSLALEAEDRLAALLRDFMLDRV